ncbi:MAG: hypothetical protein WA047_06700 [Phenylobacterium sp.]|uniref:hypothetical protein n=1 Tax=Phenylobacterium sp. TaxID=1871053 RepID=UPI003BB7D338
MTLEAAEAEAALDRIRQGDPAVIRALWESFPSPYEVDVLDPGAALAVLGSIVDAALNARPE